MTHASFLARHFYAAFTNPVHMFDVFDGTTSSVDRGVAYHVKLRKRPQRGEGWFLELPQIRRTGQYPEHFHYGNALFLVHWPTFLLQGRFPTNMLAPVVHEVLEFALPIVQQFDQVLADDIAFFRKNYDATPEEERVARPNFLGQTSTMDEERFNAHLEALVAEDCPFLRHFMESVQRSFAPALEAQAACGLNELSLDLQWRKKTSLFSPAALIRGKDCTTKLDVPDNYGEIKDPWMREIRRLLDGFSGTDGCWRVGGRGAYGNALLVNWARVAAIGVQQGREIFTTLAEDGETDFDVLGWKARLAFAGVSDNRYVTKLTRKEPLRELVRKTGFALPDMLEHPWELYSIPALLGGLERYCRNRRNAQRLILSRESATAPHKPLNANIAFLEYEGAGVQAIRRNNAILFTLPYALYAEWNTRQLSEKKRYRYRGESFWTLRGIKAHAKGHTAEGFNVPPIPEAEAFHKWAEITALSLYGQNFTKLLFDQRRGVRIGEKNRGERKHLGPFTRDEDNELRAFFESRQRGPYTEDELKRFDRVCAGRTRLSVDRRRDRLGLEFALKHGYAKYAQSGYCVHNSAKRRKDWMTMGVRA